MQSDHGADKSTTRAQRRTRTIFTLTKTNCIASATPTTKQTIQHAFAQTTHLIELEISAI